VFAFDWIYLWWVVAPTMILSAAAQLYVSSTYRKWASVCNSSGSTGAQVTQALFDRTTLRAISVQQVPGAPSGHYDPGANVVHFSQAVSNLPSVTAIAVAAHELGHVEQYQTGSVLITMRSALIPALRFSLTLSYLCIVLGLFLQLSSLIWLGIVYFGAMMVCSLLTLPVEIDASRRGLKLLEEAGLLH
jgi:uncharacterized protein